MFGYSSFSELAFCELYWYSGTASSLVVGASTLAASVTNTKPVYTGTGAVVVGSTVLQAFAKHTTPVYSSSIGISSPAATVSVIAAHTVPTYTANISVQQTGAILEATAVTTPPTYQAVAEVTVGASTIASTATTSVPVYTASVDIQLNAAYIASTAVFSSGSVSAVIELVLSENPVLLGLAEFSVPTFTGTSTLTSPTSQVTITAEHTVPVYSATISGSTGQATITGVATGAPPNYPAIALLASPTSVLSGSAQFYVPVYTAICSGTTPAPTLEAFAVTTTPTYSATCSITCPITFVTILGGSGVLIEVLGLRHSPADILRHWLVQSNVDGVSLPEEKTTKPFYVGFMPNTPNDAQVAYDVEGTSDGRHHPTGVSWLHYGVTLVVRNDTYETAWRVMHAILNHLDTSTKNATVELDSTVYQIVCVNRQGSPYSMGQDPPKEGWIKIGVNLKSPIVQLERLVP